MALVQGWVEKLATSWARQLLGLKGVWRRREYAAYAGRRGRALRRAYSKGQMECQVELTFFFVFVCVCVFLFFCS